MNCLLDKVFELGKGDLAIGTVKAFEAGIIDVPLLRVNLTQVKCCQLVIMKVISEYLILELGFNWSI